jgi:hypothetical protein
MKRSSVFGWVGSAVVVGTILFLSACGQNDSGAKGPYGPQPVQVSQLQGKWKLQSGTASRGAWTGFKVDGDQFHPEDSKGKYHCAQTLFIEERTVKLGSNSTPGCAALADSLFVITISDTTLSIARGMRALDYVKVP